MSPVQYFWNFFDHQLIYTSLAANLIGVPASALYIFTVLYAFALVYFICAAKVILGSKVRPSITGKGLVARILLFMDRLRDFECSAGSGVNRVVCVLLVLRIRLFLVAQVAILSRYGCRVLSAVL